MNYFIITFQITINGEYRDTGTIGIASPSSDYHTYEIKNVITDHYKELFPSATSFAVSIQNDELVSKDQYETSSDKFLVTLS